MWPGHKYVAIVLGDVSRPYQGGRIVSHGKWSRRWRPLHRSGCNCKRRTQRSGTYRAPVLSMSHSRSRRRHSRGWRRWLKTLAGVSRLGYHRPRQVIVKVAWHDHEYIVRLLYELGANGIEGVASCAANDHDPIVRRGGFRIFK